MIFKRMILLYVRADSNTVCHLNVRNGQLLFPPPGSGRTESKRKVEKESFTKSSLVLTFSLCFLFCFTPYHVP